MSRRCCNRPVPRSCVRFRPANLLASWRAAPDGPVPVPRPLTLPAQLIRRPISQRESAPRPRGHSAARCNGSSPYHQRSRWCGPRSPLQGYTSSRWEVACGRRRAGNAHCLSGLELAAMLVGPLLALRDPAEITVYAMMNGSTRRINWRARAFRCYNWQLLAWPLSVDRRSSMT